MSPAARARCLNARDPLKIRTDIQVLRGIAVLLVVFYHSGLVELQAGYLGVDVFFVISGFLITGLIMREIAAGRFSIRQFYWRRAKRLLPASIVVLLLTALAATVLLTNGELEEFRSQLLGAVTFTANFVLWRQTGYFESAADAKPLLHMWSLSVEEQFYLVVPATLLLIAKRWWTALITAGTIASAALCFYMVEAHPAAAFYLLPTRAWQLGIGALAAIVAARSELRERPLVGLLAIAAILGLAVDPLDPVHPRGGALLASLATAAAILARPAFLNRGPVAHGIARVGDISYSLYLVHWPLFAFANVLYVGERAPWLVSAGLVAASLQLAWLLYVTIESPIHRSRLEPRLAMVSALVACTALVLVPPALAGHFRTGDTDWQRVMRANVGLGPECDYKGLFAPQPNCMTDPEPAVLVWGDSIAMMMLSGIVNGGDESPSVIQATRSACGPVVGVRPQVSKTISEASAEECLRFNESVLSYAIASHSISHVVLSKRIPSVPSSVLPSERRKVPAHSPSLTGLPQRS